MTRDDLLTYIRRSHSRTERLIPLVPEPLIEWSPGRGAMSFGDILRHLAGLERWMWAENVHGRPSQYPGHSTALANGYGAVRDYYQTLVSDAEVLFSALDEAGLRARVATPAAATLPAWKWLRAMVEHHAHHRGQLYLMLRLVDVETPPVFGRTSEEVYASSERRSGAKPDTAP